jgi:ribonuclease HI
MTQCCNVYTDGSFKHSRGGFGVYVNDDRGRRTSLCGPVSNKKTNNTAELTAVIKAVDFCKTNISRPVRIFTDSSYVILSLTKLKLSTNTVDVRCHRHIAIPCFPFKSCCTYWESGPT